jgi:hypothetical protein
MDEKAAHIVKQSKGLEDRMKHWGYTMQSDEVLVASPQTGRPVRGHCIRPLASSVQIAKPEKKNLFPLGAYVEVSSKFPPGSLERNKDSFKAVFCHGFLQHPKLYRAGVAMRWGCPWPPPCSPVHMKTSVTAACRFGTCDASPCSSQLVRLGWKRNSVHSTESRKGKKMSPNLL